MLFKRRTKTSESVIKILEKTRRPLSIQELIGLLKEKKIEPNKTTVYRMIDKLLKRKAIYEIMRRNGTTYYELNLQRPTNQRQSDQSNQSNKSNKHHHHHHHHFFCNECELVECLEACYVDKNQTEISRLLPNKKHMITAHDFNLYGICEGCSTTPVNKEKKEQVS